VLAADDVLQPFSAAARLLVRQPQHAKQATVQPTLLAAQQVSRSSMTPDEWQQCQNKAQEAPQLMMDALAMMQQFQTPEGQWHGSQQQFMQLVNQIILAQWRCGNTHYHFKAWEVALAQRKGSGNVAEVLRAVGQGIPLHLLPAYSHGQQHKPDFTRKEQAVRSMLGGNTPDVNSLMHEAGLPSVWCGNLRSATEPSNLPFMRAEVGKAVRSGVAVAWQQDWGDPHTISPVGCAANRKGKRRMILAPLLLNFFEKYQAFQQEHLKVRASACGRCL
jgi:hypothetical protein